MKIWSFEQPTEAFVGRGQKISEFQEWRKAILIDGLFERKKWLEKIYLFNHFTKNFRRKFSLAIFWPFLNFDLELAW